MYKLLSNAEKYSTEERWIGVKVRQVVGFVEVLVSDTGIGFAWKIWTIFELFFVQRTKCLTSQRNRIGLSITKVIMQAHGGDVIVRSNLGEGSTFILRFQKICSATMRDKICRWYLLFVEDEQPVLNTLLRFFSRQGYQTQGAQTPEVALELIQNNQFDLAVLDVMLHESGGGDGG